MIGSLPKSCKSLFHLAKVFKLIFMLTDVESFPFTLHFLLFEVHAFKD